jgi:hypothetical protein
VKLANDGPNLPVLVRIRASSRDREGAWNTEGGSRMLKAVLAAIMRLSEFPGVRKMI